MLQAQLRPPASPRGERPLDVDAEVEKLLADRVGGAGAGRRPRRCARRCASWWSPATSARQRQGKEPLDVEQEIERQLRELENLGQ